MEVQSVKSLASMERDKMESKQKIDGLIAKNTQLVKS